MVTTYPDIDRLLSTLVAQKLLEYVLNSPSSSFHIIQ